MFKDGGEGTIISRNYLNFRITDIGDSWEEETIVSLFEDVSYLKIQECEILHKLAAAFVRVGCKEPSVCEMLTLIAVTTTLQIPEKSLHSTPLQLFISLSATPFLHWAQDNVHASSLFFILNVQPCEVDDVASSK